MDQTSLKSKFAHLGSASPLIHDNTIRNINYYEECIDSIVNVCISMDDICENLDDEFPNAMRDWMESFGLSRDPNGYSNDNTTSSISSRSFSRKNSATHKIVDIDESWHLLDMPARELKCIYSAVVRQSLDGDSVVDITDNVIRDCCKVPRDSKLCARHGIDNGQFCHIHHESTGHINFPVSSYDTLLSTDTEDVGKESNLGHEPARFDAAIVSSKDNEECCNDKIPINCLRCGCRDNNETQSEIPIILRHDNEMNLQNCSKCFGTVDGECNQDKSLLLAPSTRKRKSDATENDLVQCLDFPISRYDNVEEHSVDGRLENRSPAARSDYSTDVSIDDTFTNDAGKQFVGRKCARLRNGKDISCLVPTRHSLDDVSVYSNNLSSQQDIFIDKEFVNVSITPENKKSDALSNQQKKDKIKHSEQTGFRRQSVPTSFLLPNSRSQFQERKGSASNNSIQSFLSASNFGKIENGTSYSQEKKLCQTRVDSSSTNISAVLDFSSDHSIRNGNDKDFSAPSDGVGNFDKKVDEKRPESFVESGLNCKTHGTEKNFQQQANTLQEDYSMDLTNFSFSKVDYADLKNLSNRRNEIESSNGSVTIDSKRESTSNLFIETNQRRNCLTKHVATTDECSFDKSNDPKKTSNETQQAKGNMLDVAKDVEEEQSEFYQITNNSHSSSRNVLMQITDEYAGVECQQKINNNTDQSVQKGHVSDDCNLVGKAPVVCHVNYLPSSDIRGNDNRNCTLKTPSFVVDSAINKNGKANDVSFFSGFEKITRDTPFPKSYFKYNQNSPNKNSDQDATNAKKDFDVSNVHHEQMQKIHEGIGSFTLGNSTVINKQKPYTNVGNYDAKENNKEANGSSKECEVVIDDKQLVSNCTNMSNSIETQFIENPTRNYDYLRTNQVNNIIHPNQIVNRNDVIFVNSRSGSHENTNIYDGYPLHRETTSRMFSDNGPYMKPQIFDIYRNPVQTIRANNIVDDGFEPHTFRHNGIPNNYFDMRTECNTVIDQSQPNNEFSYKNYPSWNNSSSGNVRPICNRNGDQPYFRFKKENPYMCFPKYCMPENSSVASQNNPYNLGTISQYKDGSHINEFQGNTSTSPSGIQNLRQSFDEGISEINGYMSYNQNGHENDNNAHSNLFRQQLDIEASYNKISATGDDKNRVCDSHRIRSRDKPFWGNQKVANTSSDELQETESGIYFTMDNSIPINTYDRSEQWNHDSHGMWNNNIQPNFMSSDPNYCYRYVPECFQSTDKNATELAKLMNDEQMNDVFEHVVPSESHERTGRRNMFNPKNQVFSSGIYENNSLAASGIFQPHLNYQNVDPTVAYSQLHDCTQNIQLQSPYGNCKRFSNKPSQRNRKIESSGNSLDEMGLEKYNSKVWTLTEELAGEEDIDIKNQLAKYSYLLENEDDEDIKFNLFNNSLNNSSAISNKDELKCNVAGVYWDRRSWIASWYEGGRRYYKSFSAKAYGFNRSKYSAIKVRLTKNKVTNSGLSGKNTAFPTDDNRAHTQFRHSSSLQAGNERNYAEFI